MLAAATATGVEYFVFSSSAAVYGEPDVELVWEDHLCRPINPYGQTKRVGERMVADVAEATGLRCVNLRYFNVVGAARPQFADHRATNLGPWCSGASTTSSGPSSSG